MSEQLGQDGNYDLVNYHLANGAALLHGTFYRDLLPAGTQSYFNPVLDAAYAFLALGPLSHSPRVLAAVMGLWAGAAAFLAWRLARLLYPGRPVLTLLAAVLAVTGVALVAEIGTTFNDLPDAVLVLGSLLVLLAPPRRGAMLLAGGLFGAAVGLKLTAIVFVPAWYVALAALHRPRHLPRAAAMATLGALAGWTVTDGWWAVMLWFRFASPTFPLLNGVFRSPWYPPADFVDQRFIPAGLLQALDFPIRWFFWDPVAAGELPARDPRLALTLVLGILAALAAIARRGPALPPRHRATLLFLATGYAAWLATSGILRYAIVLEVLAGLCIPLLLARLVRGPALAAGLAAIVLLAATTTQYGSWGRVAYGQQVFRAETDWVRPGMLVVLTLREPVAHIIPLLPFQNQISVLGLDFALLDARGWTLHDEALRRVREHAGPIAVVTGVDPAGRHAELGEIGLDPVLTNCRSVATTFYRPGRIKACDAARLDQPAMPGPFWRQAAARYRTLARPSHGTGPLTGEAYLRAAGPAARGTRFVDWADLLWRGVGRPNDIVPAVLDPGTLYVLDPEFVAPFAARMNPAHDALGQVDGLTVLAPGWRDCPACTAPLTPSPSPAAG